MAEQNEETIRAFVAIRVSSQVTEELNTMRDRMADLLPEAIYAKFRPETAGFHITLRFLGDVTLDQVKALGIRDPVTDLSSKRLEQSCNLALGRLGMFPEEGPPTILNCAVQGDVPALRTLQAGIGQRADEAGFPPAQFPFNPHITLGRFRDLTDAEGEAVRRAVRGALDPGSVAWTANTVSVLKSVRLSGGYGVIYSEFQFPRPPQAPRFA